MGLGKTVDKILYLIIKEGERQQPNTKIQMLAKWERDRLEAKRLIALTYENRKRLLELGISPEYLDAAEENGDVPE
jgi:hypothetical protein